MDVRLRASEGCATQPFLLWDTVWSPNLQAGDWSLADADEALNRGGLRAKSALATAVILALFTDRRCPPDHPLAQYSDGDPRGWWGDGVDIRDDLGEAPLGSLLWLLERAPITDMTAQWARAMAEEALAPLLKQKSVATVRVSSEIRKDGHGVNLLVEVAAHDGVTAFDGRFEVVWDQVR